MRGARKHRKNIMKTTKQKQQHTPGPWIAGNATNGRILKRWRIYRSGAKTVAEICDNNSSEIEYANARLIAAAPELLSALEDLTKAARVIDGNLPVRDMLGAVGALQAAAYHADRIISKATLP